MLMVTAKENLEQVLGRANQAASLPPPVTQWVMVLVRPGHEQEARDCLRRRGVGAWWPNYEKEIGAKDRESGKRYKKLVRVGVLSCVILCPARIDDRFWQAVDFATGVTNVARKPNGSLVMLDDIDIALIHTIEAGLNQPAPVKDAHSYSVGDVVRLVDDEFRRLPAAKIVSIFPRSGEIEVEVNMFGRVTPVRVRAWQIEPVDTENKNHSVSKSSDARDRPAKSPSRRR